MPAFGISHTEASFDEDFYTRVMRHPKMRPEAGMIQDRTRKISAENRP